MGITNFEKRIDAPQGRRSSRRADTQRDTIICCVETLFVTTLFIIKVIHYVHYVHYVHYIMSNPNHLSLLTSNSNRFYAVCQAFDKTS